jgi:hypothetical protein
LEQNGVVESEVICDLCNCLVVVARIYWWGLEWVLCGSLNKCLSDEPRSTIEWVDFQLSEELLFCLSTSDLIGLWDLSTGNLIVQLDILLSNITANRNFKRFLRASNSVLLGAIEELGVIYLASVDEIISDKTLIASTSDPYLDPLIAWRVASQEIGTLAFGSIRSKEQFRGHKTVEKERIRSWK